jgi:hypothetical protein
VDCEQPVYACITCFGATPILARHCLAAQKHGHSHRHFKQANRLLYRISTTVVTVKLDERQVVARLMVAEPTEAESSQKSYNLDVAVKSPGDHFAAKQED